MLGTKCKVLGAGCWVLGAVCCVFFSKCWGYKRTHTPPTHIHRGIFTMDEVYILGKLVMNAKSHQVVGWTVNQEQLGTLDCLYRKTTNNEPPLVKQAMVCMWRDLDSKFDIVGPLVGSASGLTHRQINTYFWKSVEGFQQAGFSTDLCVLDGASWNLKFIQLNCPKVGYTSPELVTWRFNPYTGFRIYFIMDPEHMFKNLRNALFSSNKSSKPRHFTISKELLEKWASALFDKSKRPDPDWLTGLLPPASSPPTSSATPAPDSSFVPAPTNSSAQSIATTPGLNCPTSPVPPAAAPNRIHFGKGHLIEHYTALKDKEESPNGPRVLSETLNCLTDETLFLTSRSAQTVRLVSRVFDPRTVASITNVASKNRSALEWQALVHFLQAGQDIYSNFFMSGYTVSSMDNPCVQNILDGFRFFAEWHRDWDNDPYLATLSKSEKNRHFLDKITWLELKVTVAGVLGFLNYRFETFRGSSVTLSRVSQSALEGVFGFCRGINTWGHGKLTLLALRKGLGVVRFTSADVVSTRYLQVQSLQLQGTVGTSFSPHMDMMKIRRSRDRIRGFLPSSSPVLPKYGVTRIQDHIEEAQRLGASIFTLLKQDYASNAGVTRQLAFLSSIMELEVDTAQPVPGFTHYFNRGGLHLIPESFLQINLMVLDFYRDQTTQQFHTYWGHEFFLILTRNQEVWDQWCLFVPALGDGSRSASTDFHRETPFTVFVRWLEIFTNALVGHLVNRRNQKMQSGSGQLRMDFGHLT